MEIALGILAAIAGIAMLAGLIWSIWRMTDEEAQAYLDAQRQDDFESLI